MPTKKYFDERLFMNEMNLNSFNQEGFFSCNFLNVNEISELKTILDSVEIPPILFYHSHGHLNASLGGKFDEIISTFIMERMDGIGLNKKYKSFTGVYILKKSDKSTSMHIHADDSFIDESKYTPINIWIPLVDVSSDNGTICVIPKSHHNTQTYRGRTTKDLYLEKHDAEFKENHLPINLSAGQALIYHPGIIHFSPPNLSEQTRPVVAVSMIPENTIPHFYFEQRRLFRKKRILVYSLEYDFFYNWNNKNKPNSKPLKIITE